MPADRSWSKRLALATFLLALTGSIAVAFIDQEERQSIVRLAASDIQAAANKLAQVHPATLGSCPITSPPSDLDLLADALAAVEQLSTSSFERAFEETVVRLAIFTGSPAPDFSLGPGQIRPSTAEAAVRSASAAGAVEAGAPDRQPIALDLISDCANHELGVLVLKMMLGTKAATGDQLSRKTIMHLAGEYNAQTTNPTSEAAIANYLYRELTYQVFQEFKFQHRPSAQASSGRKVIHQLQR